MDSNADVVVIYDGSNPCRTCLGWKRVDDGEGYSWKYWATLPAPSNIAVQIGMVKPVKCPDCQGTGVEK